MSANRLDKNEATHRSEFRYGTFTRVLPLPAEADTGHVQASYGDGVLEIMVKLAAPGPEAPERPVPVRVREHITPD